MGRVKELEITEASQTAVACCAPLAATALTDVEADATAGLFKALADPARVRIVNLLLSSEEAVCVCDIVPTAGLSQPTVSHHLRKLMDAGLLRREERGTWAYYSVDHEAMDRLRLVADVRKGSRRPA
jgi:ArsR family transcriptional regulator, arsenate/arsenite/antimonite-responsive transcriptional repressor